MELSLSCNLMCSMCPRQFLKTPNGLMSRELFIKIVDEISYHPVSAVVVFFRGESLLHPDFLFMVDYLKMKTQAVIQLATNGVLMTPETGKYLLEAGMDFISFSVDAFKKETYERIRKGGDFEKVLGHIHGFLKMKHSGNHTKTQVQVSATQTDYNEAELFDFTRYWAQYADRVRIYPRHSENGKFGKISKNNDSSALTQRAPCRKLFNDMVVYYTGDVAICNHDWNRGRKGFIGNLNTKGIKEIWNGEAYTKIREKHNTRNWGQEPVCSLCDHWYTGKDVYAGNLIQGKK